MEKERFQAELQAKTKEIEALLTRYLPEEKGYQKTVLEAMNYSLMAGGKRLRPMMMQETYRLFGGNGTVIEPFMAAIEMIHTYSLVHDDLPAMDDDEYRRGRKTTHTVYGEAIGILAGDGLLICTPTGSTAYSLSAGGAILTPEVPVFMMTPICAFSMRTRPIVFSDADEFTLKIKKGKAIVLSDGKVVSALPQNTEIHVKKAPFTADFPVKDGSQFFDRIRNKLNG